MVSLPSSFLTTNIFEFPQDFPIFFLPLALAYRIVSLMNLKTHHLNKNNMKKHTSLKNRATSRATSGSTKSGYKSFTKSKSLSPSFAKASISNKTPLAELNPRAFRASSVSGTPSHTTISTNLHSKPKLSTAILVTLSCGIISGLAAIWYTQRVTVLPSPTTITLDAVGVSSSEGQPPSLQKEVHTIEAPLYNEPLEVSNEVGGFSANAGGPPSLEEPINNQAPLPRGFGLEGKQTLGGPESLAQVPSTEIANPGIADSVVGNLQSPTSQVAQANQIGSGPGLVEAIDPREIGVSVNEGPEKDYEETALSVQRTLTAVLDDGDKQLIRMKVPVMYLSRTLRLGTTEEQKAKEILASLKTKREELSKIKGELDSILLQWNNLVESGSPSQVLMPESPSLPANQSLGDLNREDNPELEPGKAITYEVVEDKKP